MATVNFFSARLSSLTVTLNDFLLVHSSIMIIILEDTHLVSLKTREVFNPLMAVAAIWRFEVITRAAVCLNPADMYLYTFQCSMRVF